jgi:alpha-glucosidase (family GH31 glycosyl hydrolase)
MLSDATVKKNHRQNLHQIATKKDLFVKDRNGKVFNATSVSDYHVSTLDFENPKAVEFFKNLIIDALNETQANGMMVDFS